MQKRKEEGTDSLQIVCFRIGNEEYGIDILQAQEILKVLKVTKLPKSEDYILGVMDLRGKIIPIVDLGKKFGIMASISDALRAIVVNIGGKQVGLAIDSVSHVVKVNSSEIEPPPPVVVKGISGKYIMGIAKVNESLVIILDVNRIFTDEEILSLDREIVD